jgi:hypothetical protein
MSARTRREVSMCDVVHLVATLVVLAVVAMIVMLFLLVRRWL